MGGEQKSEVLVAQAKERSLSLERQAGDQSYFGHSNEAPQASVSGYVRWPRSRVECNGTVRARLVAQAINEVSVFLVRIFSFFFLMGYGRLTNAVHRWLPFISLEVIIFFFSQASRCGNCRLLFLDFVLFAHWLGWDLSGKMENESVIFKYFLSIKRIEEYNNVFSY